MISAAGEFFRRTNRQLKHLAQGSQVCCAWAAVIGFPEIDARLANTDLLRDFGDRQATLDSSFTQVLRQIRFARQFVLHFTRFGTMELIRVDR
jgi:hypothetical protein